MTEKIPTVKSTNEKLVNNIDATQDKLPEDYQVGKIEIDAKTLEDIKDLAAEIQFRAGTKGTANEEIGNVLNKRNTVIERYDATPVVDMPSKKNFFKKATSFTLGLLGLGAINATAEVNANSNDSLKNNTVKTSTFEDSTKTNKSVGAIEMKSVGVTWIEANENVGGLELEGKAIVPFSDTSKIVSILKFSSGSAEEMIAAAQKAGYKILSYQDFKKMYTENQNQSKKLAQTFCGEQATDVDDTKPELYQKITDKDVETNIKKTHAVYPYIGLTGSLTRYEESESLNYEAGLAVYKENK